MARAYYNEIDPYAAAWLRNLIAAGHIAPGDVDERSIADVRPDDLKGYTQAHFFAGIGGWSLAARLAGWPDDKPLWTGSCPCQPFSAAGKRKGTADERHLWPVFAALIRKCRPAVVAGEQVASKDGLGWLDGVCADLEAADYAWWAGDYCAAGVGAPHIRQRLWWLGHANNAERPARHVQPVGTATRPERVAQSGPSGWLADADGRNAGAERQQPGGQHGQQPAHGGAGLGHADDEGSQGRYERRDGADERLARSSGLDGGLAHADIGTGGQGCAIGGRRPPRSHAVEGPGPRGSGVPDDRLEHADGQGERRRALNGEMASVGRGGFWDRYALVPCRDGTARRIEPGVFPLAHGVSGRVGRLRAYGNAIVPQVAAEILRAYLDGPVLLEDPFA